MYSQGRARKSSAQVQPGQINTISENKLKAKALGELQLKRWSACLSNTRPRVQTPVLPKK
jgi:hypothetical protein